MKATTGSWKQLPVSQKVNVGRDSSVGIATRYRLDVPGIELQWQRDFPHPSRPVLGPTKPPIQWYRICFPKVKRPGRGVDHPPPNSAEVKERVDLCLYSAYGPSWPVLGPDLHSFFIRTVILVNYISEVCPGTHQIRYNQNTCRSTYLFIQQMKEQRKKVVNLSWYKEQQSPKTCLIL
jgi:hypothetical protein